MKYGIAAHQVFIRAAIDGETYSYHVRFKVKDSLGESGFSYVGWIICGQAFVNEKEKQDELKRSIESQLECIRLFMEKGPDVIPSSSLGKKEVKISIFNILTLKYFVALYLNWRYKKIPTFTDAEIRKWSESSK